MINTIPHALTGYQMLWHIQGIWSRHKTNAVALLIHRGQSASVMNSVRVACSRDRERNRLGRDYEMRFSDPIPVSVPSAKLDKPTEAEYLVVARLSGGKQTRFAAAINAVKKQGGNIE